MDFFTFVFCTFAADFRILYENLNRNHEQHKRLYIRGSFFLHIRISPFFHHILIGFRLFLFRSAYLPLGNRFTHSGNIRCTIKRNFPYQPERLGNCIRIEPAPGSNFTKPCYCLPTYRQRSGIHHSFHVSAGSCPRHDILLPGKEIILHSVCRTDFAGRCGIVIIGRDRL